MAVPRSPRPPQEYNPTGDRWRRERDAAIARVKDLEAEVAELRAQQGIPHVQYGVAFPDDDNVMTAPTADIARAWAQEYANLAGATGAARVQRRTVTRNATAWEDVADGGNCDE